VKSQPCEVGTCRKSAFIRDTRISKVVCADHRVWECAGCGGEHQHGDLNRYSDDFEHWLSCPRTGAILAMGFWGPVPSLPPGTGWDGRCGRCMGLGRCECVTAELGGHERCLRCDGDERCFRCQGSGLRT
jgi:hypothetical protein